MPTVSFFYDRNLIAIRKAVAPAARWDTASKSWSMTDADADAFAAAASAVFLEGAIDIDGIPAWVPMPGADLEYRILRSQDLGASLSVLVDEYGRRRRLIIRPRGGQADAVDLSVLRRLNLSRSTEWVDGEPAQVWAAPATAWVRVLTAFGAPVEHVAAEPVRSTGFQTPRHLADAIREIGGHHQAGDMDARNAARARLVRSLPSPALVRATLRDLQSIKERSVVAANREIADGCCSAEREAAIARDLELAEIVVRLAEILVRHVEQATTAHA